MAIIISILLVLLIIYAVPFVVYSIFALLFHLKPPEPSAPVRFLISVLISKLGTAIAFVGIFSLAYPILHQHGLLYAALWWVMFVIGEIAETLKPTYTWSEAIAGILSETIYCPLATYAMLWILSGTS